MARERRAQRSQTSSPRRERVGAALRSSRRNPVPQFRLRRIRPSDLGTLVLHQHRMWADSWTDIFDTPLPSSRNFARTDRLYRLWLRGAIRTRRFVGFLAEDSNGTVLGSGYIWLVTATWPPPWPLPGPPVGPARRFRPYLTFMYTAPTARRKGVASEIVTEVMRWCREHGYPTILLHASKMGRGVYARLGFRPPPDYHEMVYRFPRGNSGRPTSAAAA